MSFLFWHLIKGFLVWIFLGTGFLLFIFFLQIYLEIKKAERNDNQSITRTFNVSLNPIFFLTLIVTTATILDDHLTNNKKVEHFSNTIAFFTLAMSCNNFWNKFKGKSQHLLQFHWWIMHCGMIFMAWLA